MPRTSHSTPESQRRAAHNRFHRNKGIVKSSCAICRQENPNSGIEVVLGEDGKQPEPIQILLPIPETEIPLEDEWRRKRIYKFAGLRHTAETVATGLGMSAAALEELVLSEFQVTYSALSERASIEVQLEIESVIHERAKAGEFRFVVWYSKLKDLPGFYEQIGNPNVLPPESLKRELRSLSVEELQKMRTGFERVIDRPSRFDTIGALSPTVSIRPATNEEKQQARKPYTPPVMPGSDADFARSQKTVTFTKPDLRIEPERPKQQPEPLPQAPIEAPAQGPITYHPEPGVLEL